MLKTEKRKFRGSALRRELLRFVEGKAEAKYRAGFGVDGLPLPVPDITSSDDPWAWSFWNVNRDLLRLDSERLGPSFWATQVRTIVRRSFAFSQIGKGDGEEFEPTAERRHRARWIEAHARLAEALRFAQEDRQVWAELVLDEPRLHRLKLVAPLPLEPFSLEELPSPSGMGPLTFRRGRSKPISLDADDTSDDPTGIIRAIIKEWMTAPSCYGVRWNEPKPTAGELAVLTVLAGWKSDEWICDWTVEEALAHATNAVRSSLETQGLRAHPARRGRPKTIHVV